MIIGSLFGRWSTPASVACDGALKSGTQRARKIFFAVCRVSSFHRSREILGWRMRFIPYLRAAFARYASDGTPPFRALALDWPEVPALAKTDDAWMVGDRLLVAPLFAGEPDGRKLTLPPGEWFDLWSGKAVSGGTTIHIAPHTRNIPVF